MDDPERKKADPKKEKMPAAVLAAMINRRLRWVPQVHEELARNSAARLRPYTPEAHDLDPQGRSWDTGGFECGSLNTLDCERQFRLIVDRLRDEFDLR